MSALPAFPSHVSADGSEIWDWGAKLGEAVQRADKMRELSADIARVRCGSCKLWMDRKCPKEVHSSQTGRSSGPSMNGVICGKFDEKASSAELRAKRRDELAALHTNATGAA